MVADGGIGTPDEGAGADEGADLRVWLPLADWEKDLPTGCAGCGLAGDFVLREAEVGQMPVGWVLVIIYRQINNDGITTIRWKPYCPDCAPEPDWRERLGAQRYRQGPEHGSEREDSS